jgi:hypothetical protein
MTTATLPSREKRVERYSDDVDALTRPVFYPTLRE